MGYLSPRSLVGPEDEAYKRRGFDSTTIGFVGGAAMYTAWYYASARFDSDASLSLSIGIPPSHGRT